MSKVFIENPTNLWDRYINFLFEQECVYDKEGNVTYENVSNDPGGLTKYGIDLADHPGLGTDGIQGLTQQAAIQVYASEFKLSNALKLRGVAQFVFFDAAVNEGEKEATIILQSVVGVATDGAFGLETYKATTEITPLVLSIAMIDRREESYQRIVASKPNEAVFLPGWTNRCNDLRTWVNANS